MNETPRTDNQARAFIDELVRMEPEQRRHLRQVCFWVLLIYLEFEWASTAAIPLGIAAAAMTLVAWLARRTAYGQRPSFLVLHGAIAVQMILILLRAQSWLLFADFAAISVLAALELEHRKPMLLIAIAVEHALALAFDPSSALRFLADHSRPESAALAWARLFAIIMVIAIVIRTRFVPPPPPEPPPPPKRARPMTAREWDAQQRNR